MSTPTKSTIIGRYQTDAQKNDFLQLENKDGGAIFGGIDGAGYRYGTLAAGGIQGVLVKTADYQVTSDDNGQLISVNSSGTVNLTMPVIAPDFPWFIQVECVGAGTVVIHSTPTIDGSSSTVTLSQNQGILVVSNAVSYFTQRGVGGAGGSGFSGVSAQTGDYTALNTDTGKLITFIKATAVALTLPSSAPGSTWFIYVENRGAGFLTINRNGLNIDGAANNIGLLQNQGTMIFCDGSNYFTSRGISGIGNVNSQTDDYTAIATDSGKLISMSKASSVQLTLPATSPGPYWVTMIQNVGAGTLTVNRNGLNIDGVASNLSLSTGQGVIIYTDGTNYFTERGTAAAVNVVSPASYLGWHNVKDYGAVGDGVTDDSAAIQAAVNASTGYATITNTVLTSNVATFTAANTNYAAGHTVDISGCANAAYNGNGLTVLSASATQFTVAITHANIGSSAEVAAASWDKNVGGTVYFPATSINYYVANTITIGSWTNPSTRQVYLLGDTGSAGGGTDQFANAPRVGVQGLANPVFELISGGTNSNYTLENLNITSTAAHNSIAVRYAGAFTLFKNCGFTSLYENSYPSFDVGALVARGNNLWSRFEFCTFGTQHNNLGLFREVMTVTSVDTTAGGVAVYHGTFTKGAANNVYVGMKFTVAGFVTHTSNNGTFQCTASTATTITLANIGAIAETHSATIQASQTADPSSWTPPAFIIQCDDILSGSILYNLDNCTWSFGGCKAVVYAFPDITLTSCDNFIGNLTRYHGTIPADLNVGRQIHIAGFTDSRNNGDTWVTSTDGATYFDAYNVDGVAETHAATVTSGEGGGESFGEMIFNMNVLEGQFGSPLFQFENVSSVGGGATLARITMIESQLADLAHPTPLIFVKGTVGGHSATIGSIFLLHCLSHGAMVQTNDLNYGFINGVWSDDPSVIQKVFDLNDVVVGGLVCHTNAGIDTVGSITGPAQGYQYGNAQAGGFRTFRSDGVAYTGTGPTATSMRDADGTDYFGAGVDATFDLSSGRTATATQGLSAAVLPPTSFAAVSAGGGTLADGTYYLRISSGDLLNTNICSAASTEISVVLSNGGTNAISCTWVEAVNNSTGKNTIFIGTTPGGENKAKNVNTSSNTITSMPVSNFTPPTVGTLLANFWVNAPANFKHSFNTQKFVTFTSVPTANRTITFPDVDGTMIVSGNANLFTALQSFGANIKIGSSGTTLTQVVVYTPSLTPSSVLANTSAEQDFAVAGVTTADTISVAGPAPTAGTGIVNVRVKSNDVVSITFGNFTAGPLTPASGTYRIIAFRS
jgi:hypothetical protein